MKDYISPIEMITNSIIESADEQIDDYLLFSVEREIGFKVDKEELIKALEYDRKQYEKGFEDGLRSAKEWIPLYVENEIQPTAFKRYLFTTKDGKVEENYWNGNYKEYIAFMPKPEPYKSESEVSDD